MGERIVNLDAKVSDRALYLGVPEEQLDRAKVLDGVKVSRSSVDQRHLRSPQRMGAKQRWV
jgi:hypothetical protein